LKLQIHTSVGKTFETAVEKSLKEKWSCPYQTGHHSSLLSSLLCSLGDFIFSPL
jgi:hypothetical protein